MRIFRAVARELHAPQRRVPHTLHQAGAPRTGSRPQEAGEASGGRCGQRGVRAEEEPTAVQCQEGLADPCPVRRERGRLSDPSSHRVPLCDLNALVVCKAGLPACTETLSSKPASWRLRAGLKHAQGWSPEKDRHSGVPHAPPATVEAPKPVPSLLLYPVPSTSL